MIQHLIILLNQLVHIRDTKLWKYVVVAGIISITAFGYIQTMPSTSEQIYWETYEPSMFDEAKKRNKKIFLNFTADWCLNCKYNETIFGDEQIIEIFKKMIIIL